ncbi:MAG: carboxypeptidase regulatory-like domain-containing protein [Terriglobales bacterium]
MATLAVTGTLAAALCRSQQQQQQMVYRVQGVVLDSGGKPVSGALVQLTSLNGGSAQSTFTNSIGAFGFVVSGRGPYEASVSASFGTGTQLVPQGLMEDVVVRLSAAAPAHTTAPGDPSVSLNSLEAPAPAKAKYVQAERAIHQQKMDRAWKLINEAVKEAPHWGRAYLVRGILNFSRHDYAASHSDFATSLRYDPNNWLALTGMGKLYYATGNYPRAQHYLQQAMAQPPPHWQTYREMARLDRAEHDWAGVDAMAQRALRCRPAPPPSLHFLDGEALYYLHHFHRAGAQFSLFLAQTPRTRATATMRAAAQHNLRIVQKVLQAAAAHTN